MKVQRVVDRVETEQMMPVKVVTETPMVQITMTPEEAAVLRKLLDNVGGSSCFGQPRYVIDRLSSALARLGIERDPKVVAVGSLSLERRSDK